MPSNAWTADRPVRLFDELALAPDGASVASVEHDEPAIDGVEPNELVVLRPINGGAPITVRLPCASGPSCKPSEIAFSADGSRLGFVLKQPNDPRSYIYEVNRDGRGLVQRVAFEGALGALRYAADGTLAVLATAGAHKEVGAVKAGVSLAGEVDVTADEQRIAIVDANGLRFVSPSSLYVYQFDWRPDGSGFLATASPGNGDDQWWVARLWSFPMHGQPAMLYAPPPRQQIASPIVSPDGREVAFIGGLMSDFGSTGGDAFTLALDGHAKPVDLTPGMTETVTALDYRCAGGGLTATALRGADADILSLGRPTARPKRLWTTNAGLHLGSSSFGIACSPSGSAAIHDTFGDPPEIAFGPIGEWRDVTHINRGLGVPVVTRSLAWKSDGFQVQGWLLQPSDRVNSDDQKLITMIHGGPSAASVQAYLTEHRGRWLLDAGYDILLPNPRGSFGQGEAFTSANVRDFGHGDLRDILRGVDAALATAPIDPDALGLLGYSYGGYMAMWAVTQTDRFKAAVAGAGVSDWLSYYGENGIDRWMIPFFGASVYDDPAVYARSSPINFVKRVHTPTFEYVGDRDLECPMPQSQEFWHALHTLGVPTEFVVYPGQGHELHDAKDRADAKRRTLAWFARWLQPASR